MHHGGPNMSEKIKILFLGANPSDTTRLALGHEVREIMQRLRAARQGERFEFVQEWAVRVSDLHAALLVHEPQIVHFSGHGGGDALQRPSRSPGVAREMLPEEDDGATVGDGEILIEDDHGKAKPISTSALAQLFGLVGGIRCVVLNACHSATQAEAICQHVDAVIGMRRSIQDTAAVHFAWAFYQGLGFGKSIPIAFELGKNQIQLYGFGDEDVPLLRTRETASQKRPAIERLPERQTRKRAWLEGPEERIDPFLLRVERVATLRHPGARITRYDAPPPFAGVLEIEVDAGGFSRTSIVAAVDLAITDELAARFCTDVDEPFRRSYPQLRSMLVHQGNAAPIAMRAELDRRGIELQTFDRYQGLFDLGPYLEWQTRELDKNPAYVASAYVDPPGWIKIAGNRELEHTDNALVTISELLATQAHRRFLLVLGEFGAGKTFLLRELCRQMVKTNHPVLPVLLEMSKLEKQHSLAELLGAHFARADVPGYNFKAFEYMLGEGRIALFFDGFDELADKVTYDSATQHLDTVLSAAQGQAKVVLSSRRQHFLTEGEIHKAVEREFARKAESAVQGGYRLIMLEPFGELQIRRFLRNVLVDEAAAEARYRLLDEVKDLIGLSHNPRMLSFIAKIPEDSLRAAKEQWGEITAAKLYELLVNQWLDFEHDRARRQGSSKSISRHGLLRGVESLALSMWQSRAKIISADEIHEGIAKALATLGEPALDAALLKHIFGSGSLLVRDDEGRFSFVHRSVMEWLVAKQAADELIQGQDPPALVVDEMSALMADFFAAMAGRERTATWAREKLAFGVEVILRRNAALLLTRMGERFERVNFEGHDLRGRDFSGVDWRGANLRGADLRGAMLVGTDLRGASLAGANLSHANLRGANLARADLANANFSFAQMEGADLSMAQPLDPNRFRGAKLLEAKGISEELHDALRAAGAVPPVLRHVEPMCGIASSYKTIAFSHDNLLLAIVHENGVIRLMDAISHDSLRILAGHQGEIRWVVFSPDGTLLASGAEDKTIRLWDVVSGRELQVFRGHAAAVYCVAFAPDGTTLASGSADQSLRLWDVTTGKLMYPFAGSVSGVQAIAFSPDGQILVTGSQDRTIEFREIATHRLSRICRGHTGSIYALAFSPDGTKLISGSADSTIRVWDVTTGHTLHTFSSSEARYSSAFFTHGKLGVLGWNEESGVLWNIGPARSLEYTASEVQQTYTTAFGLDGKERRNDLTVKVARLTNSKPYRALDESRGQAAAVRSLAFSPDGNILAVGADDSTIRLWDVAMGCVRCVLKGHTDAVLSIAFSPNGKMLGSGSSDKAVRLWDVATGHHVRTFDRHVDAVLSIAFAPDGQTIASGSYDGIIRQWSVTGGSVRKFTGHKFGVRSIAFSPDGKRFVSGAHDSTVRLWDLVAGRARTFRGAASASMTVTFTTGGKPLVAGSSENTARCWEFGNHQETALFVGHTSAVQSIAFSPSCKALATGSHDNTVRLWDIETGETLRTFEGHASAVLSVAFSPDGKTLASGSYDNTVRLWDVATGQCLAILLATPEGWVAFTPDGRYKYGGNIAGSFWHVAGLCRFEPGEPDDYLNLRLPDDAPFLPTKTI